MGIVDVDALVRELADGSPCGENLEYDPAFLELEQNVQGKPEVQYGSTITPAVPPEWKLVKQQALALFERSRDLRIALPLLRSLLVLHGIPGLADGLRLIERLIDERWDTVHPQLDPDDGNDPTLRINSIATLADRATVLRDLAETTFVLLPGLGPLTLRQLDYASGEVPTPDGQTAPAMNTVEAALADMAPDALQAATDALAQAHGSVVNIEAILVRQVGSAQALSLDMLTRPLRRMRDLLQRHARTETVEEEGTQTAGENASAPAGTATAAAALAITGDITSRADVVKMLDKILSYYQRHEPSSPVPMLLERAKRLAPKSFFEIMEDLAPDSINQLLVIRGPQQEQ
jgi:type VI secretion system protein ImpA